MDIVRLADYHRTGAFSSGTPDLDDFLRNQAYDEDYGTTWVLVPERNSPEVAAFYTLNYPYELADDDDDVLDNPAVELTVLAVDSKYQGTGVGTRILRGLFDRVLDSLDEYPIDLLLLVSLPKARKWYLSRGLGFQAAASPSDGMTLYVPVVEMRHLRESDPEWLENRYLLPSFPWPPTVRFPIPVDQLEDFLRNHYNIPDDNYLDMELAEDGAWRATEVQPDLSTGRRFFGRVRIDGPLTLSPDGITISCNEEPDLTLAQLPLFDTIRKEWAEKMRIAEHEGRASFFLMRDGDYPELFPSLQARPMNVAGNVNEEMMEVWHALDDMLRQNGYNVFRRDVEGKPCEIWTTPLQFV